MIATDTPLNQGCLAPINLKLPPDTDLDSVRRKLLHALYYVGYLNPWLDLRILVLTGGLFLKAVFFADNLALNGFFVFLGKWLFDLIFLIAERRLGERGRLIVRSSYFRSLCRTGRGVKQAEPMSC
jgi:hypothetical protein